MLDTGARGSTMTFAKRGLGDVLIAWENDASSRSTNSARTSSRSSRRRCRSSPSRRSPLVDGNVDAKGTRKVAEAYLKFLYTPEAQAIIAKNHFRPIHPEFAAKADLAQFPKLDLITVDGTFGGWKQAQAKFFADGGVFDQFQKASQ